MLKNNIPKLGFICKEVYLSEQNKIHIDLEEKVICK